MDWLIPTWHHLQEMHVHLLGMEIHLVEKVLRTVVVYGFLLAFFKFAGKRELGQMSAFDLVVILILSNSLQNALIGPDNSLLGGLVGASVLYFVNKVLWWVAVRNEGVEHFFEGEPTVLIENGVVNERNLQHERMTRRELDRAIRKHELDPETDLPRIKRALLETDGSVTVVHT